MCLRTIETKERIAESDIVCYKILRMLNDGRFVTPFVNKRVPKKVLFGKRLFKPLFFTTKDIRNVGYFKEIRRGYIHCYVSKPNPNYILGCEIAFKCVIPKGTRYWYDAMVNTLHERYALWKKYHKIF